MDFTPGEEQSSARELAVRLFATATPAERGLTGFDAALWDRLGESGLLGLAVPEELGGGGLGLAEASVVAEECGRAAARVPVVPVLAAVQTLAACGRGRDRDLLADAVTGRAFAVPALAEAGVGDARRPTVTAARTEGGWELRGSRLCVAWARQAAQLIVPARTDEDEVLLALLATDAPGLLLQDEEVSSGEPHATALLEGVHVADADVLATGVDGQATLEAALTRLTLLQCAHTVGVGEAALHLAAGHVSQREQFGRPLATFQSVSAEVADRWIDVEAARLTLQQALWRFDHDGRAAKETATAAFWAADGVHRVAESAVHLHGGMGVDISYPLHRWYLAAKVDELSLGGALRQLEQLGELLAAT